ncbi:hypothetical protein NW801_11925 [Brevibacillus laterosporus]|uniref:hypothetical protein n=1 Tax=Brevibacillus TaxID=55080 RepID=UPI001BB35EA6|nr:MULTISPECIES: hypothetical protein [Brevibacillus]MCR8985746.1 hypothetical protein [Brevibacillus laterosporus]
MSEGSSEKAIADDLLFSCFMATTACCPVDEDCCLSAAFAWRLKGEDRSTEDKAKIVTA